MKIKVLGRFDTKIQEYSPQEFQEVMGAEYISKLEFQDHRLLEKVQRKCQVMDKKGKIERRQKWLGTMYCKEIAEGYSPDLVIKWIDEEIGFGVFANEPIFPTSYVSEYTGIVRKKRWLRDRKNNYCFLYPIHCFPKLVIDAEPKGSYARYINHSVYPNLEPLSVYSGGVMHLILIAIKPISKGDQLCYDYGPDYWEKRERARPLQPIHFSRLINA